MLFIYFCIYLINFISDIAVCSSLKVKTQKLMTTNGYFNRKWLQRRLRFYRGEADDRADIYVATTEKELKLR